MTREEFWKSSLYRKYSKMEKDWLQTIPPEEVPVNKATRDVMFDNFFNKFTENFCSHEEKDIMDKAYKNWWIWRSVPLVTVRPITPIRRSQND
jgi:hypothetical protein